MRRLAAHLLALALASPTAHAADGDYLKTSELLASETARELLKGDVAVHWVGASPPSYAEFSLPETYTSTSFSASPFGGSRRHCIDAFEKALGSIINDARGKGYDAIVDLRPVVDGQPMTDAMGFRCKPGYKITTVSLMGTLAKSETAARTRALEEKRSLSLPARPPAEGAVFMPLEDALASPEAKAILGDAMRTDWALPGTPYRRGIGPDDYAGQADLPPQGSKALACKQAALNALQTMVNEAKSRGYSLLVKIRSRLDDAYTPQATEYECQVNRKSVSVNLQAWLATAD